MFKTPSSLIVNWFEDFLNKISVIGAQVVALYHHFISKKLTSNIEPFYIFFGSI